MNLDDLTDEDIRKRIHDLRACVRTISLCAGSLKDGYRFDDDMADAKIAALEKSATKIGEEFSVLESIYQKLLAERRET